MEQAQSAQSFLRKALCVLCVSSATSVNLLSLYLSDSHLFQLGRNLMLGLAQG
jgi:hypothetical protein